MKIGKILSAGAVAITLISSAALAQQAVTVTGTITGINRLNGTIAI